MPFIVTLHVFSGRNDPQWIINDAQISELRTIVERKGSGTAVPVQSLLGYRGFTVRATEGESKATPLFRAPAAKGGEEASHSIAGLPEVEHFLLASGGDRLEESVVTHVRDAIDRGFPTLAAELDKKACPKCHAADAPGYNPAFWNTPAVQPHNNCYNYANNQATNTFAQPGRATGHMYTALNCASVRAGAQSDGLTAAAGFGAHLPKGKGWYVALVIWPNADYHWYRQDDVGCWSHKPGSTAARNTDNSGHAIADPQHCNRGPYTVFCTYMVTHRGVHIS